MDLNSRDISRYVAVLLQVWQHTKRKIDIIDMRPEISQVLMRLVRYFMQGCMLGFQSQLENYAHITLHDWCWNCRYTRGRELMAREPDVALLMTASGSLDIFLTRLLEFNFFCNFPCTRQQSHQQHHAAPEVSLTVWSMLLKRKFRHLPLLKIVDFA